MKITPHFSFEELTESSTAQRLCIDNSLPQELYSNLQALAWGLEKVRSLLPIQKSPMRIDSGYRCEELNTAIHGAQGSAHTLAWAADFVCPIAGVPAEIVQRISESDMQFDQLIQEGTWVHISFHPQMRRQVLTAHFGPGGTTYS